MHKVKTSMPSPVGRHIRSVANLAQLAYQVRNLTRGIVYFPRTNNNLDCTSYQIAGVHTPQPGIWNNVSSAYGGCQDLRSQCTPLWQIKSLDTIAPHHAAKLEDIIAQDLQIPGKKMICDN